MDRIGDAELTSHCFITRLRAGFEGFSAERDKRDASHTIAQRGGRAQERGVTLYLAEMTGDEHNAVGTEAERWVGRARREALDIDRIRDSDEPRAR